MTNPTDPSNASSPNAGIDSAAGTKKRVPTELDALCERYAADAYELDPIGATYDGVGHSDDRWPDFSPEGMAAQAQLTQDFYQRTSDIKPADTVDETTRSAVLDRVGLSLQLYERHLWGTELNNIASPVQSLRDVFSLMDVSTAAGVRNVVSRLGNISEALAGYRQSLEWGLDHGVKPAVRQVELVATQCDELAREESFLDKIVTERPAGVGESDFASLQEDVDRAARSAKAAFSDFATWLRRDLAPLGRTADACGRDEYELHFYDYVSAKFDLDEAYRWGWQKLESIRSEQQELVNVLFGPGVSVTEAMERLDADENYRLHGTKALQEWMQTNAERAIAALDGKHFDIPEPVKTIECMIDKAGTGGIYYTGPTDDFSRPGRMWWSVPPSETSFSTWQELTTVFHEGVPGHHLQIGQATVEKDNLNRWRRNFCWNSGYGEGWALYAEALMDELGFHEDLATRLGMLDGQRLRAARVVLDIGVHLGKTIPEGGRAWDADYAWDFLRSNVAMAPGFLRFELDRYLGWPGQAPSYMLGQRAWQQLREDYLAWAQSHSQEGHGQEATLKAFHTKALKLGSLPLQILREQVLS